MSESSSHIAVVSLKGEISSIGCSLPLAFLLCSNAVRGGRWIIDGVYHHVCIQAAMGVWALNG
jgi:hypothetical protein